MLPGYGNLGIGCGCCEAAIGADVNASGQLIEQARNLAQGDRPVDPRGKVTNAPRAGWARDGAGVRQTLRISDGWAARGGGNQCRGGRRCHNWRGRRRVGDGDVAAIAGRRNIARATAGQC